MKGSRYTMSGKKFIYNPKQANFYIANGVKCIETGINPTTNKIFWVFRWNETEQAYKLWCNRNK